MSSSMPLLPCEPSIPRVGATICWGDIEEDSSLGEGFPTQVTGSPCVNKTTLSSTQEITPQDSHNTKHILNSSPPARLQLDFRAIVSGLMATAPSPASSPSVTTSNSNAHSHPTTATSSASASPSTLSRTQDMSSQDPVCEALQFEAPLPTIQEFDAELDCSRDGLPLLFKSTGLSTSHSTSSSASPSTALTSAPTLTRTTTPISVWGNIPTARMSISEIQQQEQSLRTPPPPPQPLTRKRRHTPIKPVITPSKQIIKTEVKKKPMTPSITTNTASTSNHIPAWTPDRSKQLIHTISGSPRADSVDFQSPLNGKKQKIATISTPTSISPISVPSTPTQDVMSLPTTPQMSTTTSPITSTPTTPASMISTPSTTEVDVLVLAGTTTTTSSTPTTETKPKGIPPRTLSRKERLAQRQKQIDLGKKTAGYQAYIALVPNKRDRTSAHPKTPNIQKSCSKRSWDGQVRQWRRLLHTFDPVPHHPIGEDMVHVSDSLNTSMESDGVCVEHENQENHGDSMNRHDDDWTLVEQEDVTVKL